jgi:hypothetical protein
MAPIAPLMLYLIVFRSALAASIVVWLNFLVLHIAYLLVDWPHLMTVIEALRLDWPLLLSGILLQLAANQERIIRSTVTGVPSAL